MLLRARHRSQRDKNTSISTYHSPGTWHHDYQLSTDVMAKAISMTCAQGHAVTRWQKGNQASGSLAPE